MHFRPRVCCVDCLRVSFGWLMSLGRIVRGCITEIGRGGACVPARVALQGRIHRSSPAYNVYIFGMETPLCARPCRPARAHPSFIPRIQCVYFWYGNAAVCPPVSPCKGASVVHPRTQCVYFWYGNAAMRTFGRAHRHRPYHSKHTSPFCKDENKNFNARSNAASIEIKNNNDQRTIFFYYYTKIKYIHRYLNSDLSCTLSNESAQLQM